MFRDYITAHADEMFRDIASLIAIPSVSVFTSDPDMPYGEETKKALDLAKKISEDAGFKAENLGRCTEVRFGTGKGEKIYLAGHVDVVPVGPGWKTPPYEMTEKDGYIYGRGVLDDKGPAVAMLYALKALKAAGINPDADVRLIFGGEEEQGMTDIIWYVKEYGVPSFALTPDNSFPITNAELGIVMGDFVFKNVKSSGKVHLVSLSAGNAYNNVPDKCSAELLCDDKQSFFAAMGALDDAVKNLLSPTVDTEGFKIKITCAGIAAHGSVPMLGRSAAADMTKAIAQVLNATSSSDAFVDFVNKHYSETNGKSLGIYCKDEMSGEISLNGGIAEKKPDGSARISVDSRVPVSVDINNIISTLQSEAVKAGGEYVKQKSEPGFSISPDNKYLRTIAKSYEKTFGEPAKCVCARGGTYAKAFAGHGVALGPIDESNEKQGGRLHTTDEYISKEALIKLAELYANVIADICG